MNDSDRLEVLLHWLYARVNYERHSTAAADSFKLKNMRALAERLQNPHLQYPVVHVAGTKGKGSVSIMLGQIFAASGRKTGVYVSPHLEAINQRIMLEGLPISDLHLAEVLTSLRPIVDEMDAAAEHDDQLRPLTFFEIITAAALHYFAINQVDVAVLEVGLGGRLDSTNICEPAVCVITSISYDHMQQLGNTLAKIAYEKAGIIKSGVTVVSGVEPTATEPAEVIQSVADSRNSKLLQLGRDFQVFAAAAHRSDFKFTREELGVSLDEIELAMRGKHQYNNAALAIAACQELNRKGWSITEREIRIGLARASLPGRMEVIRRSPTVLMDIAHNLASIAALADSLQEIPDFRNSGSKILILAISKDKDAEPMLAKILPLFDTVILTAFCCNPRARDPQELLGLAHTIDPLSFSQSEMTGSEKYHVCNTSSEAWNLARSLAKEDDLICIAGSVFLVADLRPLCI